MVSKEAALKFKMNVAKKTSAPVKDKIKLGKSSVDYLASVAPKPKKTVFKVSKKNWKNIPKYKDKSLKGVPKFVALDVPVPAAVIPRSYLKTVEVPRVEFEELDPWNQVVILLNKCNEAVIKKKLDYAEFNYSKLQPFYERLDDNDKRSVFYKIQELHVGIVKLRMNKVKKLILATY